MNSSGGNGESGDLYQSLQRNEMAKVMRAKIEQEVTLENNEAISLLQEEITNLESRLNEQYSLVEDKEKALEKARIETANMEIAWSDCKNELTALKKEYQQKTMDSKEYRDLLLASQQQEEELRQLREIEAKHTAELDFKTASQVLEGTDQFAGFTDCAHAKDLFVTLRSAMDRAMNPGYNEAKRRVYFKVNPTDKTIEKAVLEPSEEYDKRRMVVKG